MDFYAKLLAKAQRKLERSRRGKKDKLRRVAQIEASVRARRNRSGRRKPPEAGLAMPVEPPRGPLPKHGGAAAPIDTD